MRAAPPLPDSAAPVFRRRVFYIPGYDPFHPRRYRELYRREGAAQAALSGYRLHQRKAASPYGWQVTAEPGFAHHSQQDIRRRLNDRGQGVLHKFTQTLAGG